MEGVYRKTKQKIQEVLGSIKTNCVTPIITRVNNRYNKNVVKFVLKKFYNIIIKSFILICIIIVFIIVFILIHNYLPDDILFQDLLTIISQTIILGFFLALYSKILVEFFKESGLIKKNRPDFKDIDNIIDQNLYMLGLTLKELHGEEESKEFIDTIKKSIKNNKKLTFNFLLCDPCSPFLPMREHEEMYNSSIENFKIENYHRLITEAIKTIARLQYIKNKIIQKENIQRSYNKKIEFEFKTYKSIPKHAVLIVDEIFFIGPYLLRKAGYNTMWIPLEGFSLQNQLKDEFDNTWNDYNTVEVFLDLEDGNNMELVYENIKNEQDPFKDLKDGEKVILKTKQNNKINFIKHYSEMKNGSHKYYFAKDNVDEHSVIICDGVKH